MAFGFPRLIPRSFALPAGHGGELDDHALTTTRLQLFVSIQVQHIHGVDIHQLLNCGEHFSSELYV